MTENAAENTSATPIPANGGVVYSRPVDGGEWQELGYIPRSLTVSALGTQSPGDMPDEQPERRDIVDEIDELVDWQMSNYSRRSGYDNNVNQERCPHAWCNRDWHGIAITRRIEQMRRQRHYDPEYRYAEDESVVLCPGSTFTGEFTPPEPRPVEGFPAGMDASAAVAAIWEQLSVVAGMPNPFLPPAWPIPDDPMPRGFRSMRAITGRQQEPRWWRCDDTYRHSIDYTPPMPGFGGQYAEHLRIDGVEVDLHYSRSHSFNPSRDAAVRHDRDENGRRRIEAHCYRAPAPNWYLRDDAGILDDTQLRELQSMTWEMTTIDEALAESTYIEEALYRRFAEVAQERFPGISIDPAALVYHRGRPDQFGYTKVTVAWRQPQPEEGIELRGGPANGTVHAGAGGARSIDQITVAVPEPVTYVLGADMSPVAPIRTATYRRAGFNTITGRTVFRPTNETRSQAA